jgi:hypothetical protein
MNIIPIPRESVAVKFMADFDGDIKKKFTYDKDGILEDDKPKKNLPSNRISSRRSKEA